MKQVAILLLLLFLFSPAMAQMLFYQDTYKGGISLDGHSYIGGTYFNSDTINFQNVAPIGSTIRKAFLISRRFNELITHESMDTPLKVNYNGTVLSFDSSDIVTYKYLCQLGGTSNWMVAKDVTNFTFNNANRLITPQSYLQNYNYYEVQYLLIILYDNSSMPTTNAVIFLNDQTYFSSMNYSLNNINPINNSKDVGLSVEADNTNSGDTMRIALNSSQGVYNLGKLYDPSNSPKLEHKAPGSFYYQNNTLYGLVDDSPNNLVDSTDALANIQPYIANNTTNFDLNVTLGATFFGCYDVISAIVLAYSTPCPAIQNISRQIEHICGAGNSVQISAVSNGSSYSWYTGYALSDSTIRNPVASPALTTNYVVTVTDSIGCHHTELHRVIVKEPPQIKGISVTSFTCGPNYYGSATVTPVVSDTSYTYNIGNGSQKGNIIVGLTPGTYTVTLTNDIGCTAQQPFTINLFNPTKAAFSFQPDTACLNAVFSFSNQSSNVNGYSWLYNDTLFSDQQNPAYIFTHSGTYTVTLIAYNTQPTCSDTTSHILSAQPCYFSISYPNVFTPNGDGINDTWQPIIKDMGFQVNAYSLTIYDRWGLKVFESMDINKGWDAHTTSGLECTDGTYYYLISYQTDSPTGETKRQTQKGFLQLIR